MARAIETKGGSLKLETVLARIADMGFDPPTVEGMLRYLVGRGDFVAKVSPKRKTVRLSLSAIARARESHRTFASSFAHELGMQSEQIGRLIAHGPTIGSEREELLRALIERHVPRRFHVATGFIEGSDRQVDILVYDQVDYAPLFRAGNLVAVPIKAVRGLIEVKSTLTAGELADALTHLDDAMGIRTQGPPIFRGVFGYHGATAQTLVDTFVDLNGKLPLWRIPAWRMKRDLDRKEELNGDHLVPLTAQALAVLRALWPLTGEGELLFPSNRHTHRPMSENAIGYLLNRAGYHGHHVPHGFRAAFSTIMNEWAEREGKDHDRQVIDLMLAHVPKAKVESAYNRAAYMPRRRELATVWADMLSDGLPDPGVLIERPSKSTGERSRRQLPEPLAEDFRFPRWRRAA